MKTDLAEVRTLEQLMDQNFQPSSPIYVKNAHRPLALCDSNRLSVTETLLTQYYSFPGPGLRDLEELREFAEN